MSRSMTNDGGDSVSSSHETQKVMPPDFTLTAATTTDDTAVVMEEHHTTSAKEQPHRSRSTLSTNDLQLLLMGLCLKPETPATLQKLQELVEEELTWDAGFVLCVAEDGSSPLHYAAKSNNYKVCEYLVERTNIRLSCRDKEQRLPLHYAIANYNMPLIDLLLLRSPARSITHELLYRGGTLLHFATPIDVSSRAPVVERLVLLGADPLQPDANGVTAYDMAKSRGLCSAFYLNNYLLNRTVGEDRFTMQPEDIDDDEVVCRQQRAGFVAAADGYFPHERRTVKYNKEWWMQGLADIHDLTAFVV
jgi:ankyrin repeat protein